METLTPQKGAFAVPRIPVTNADIAPTGPEPEAVSGLGISPATEQVLGTTALLSEVDIASDLAPGADQRRRGYREDSPPEVIGLLHQAQAGNAEAYGDLYRLHVERVSRYVA